ncbi:multidrug effflux MFS transporter [Vibrio tubiashii]|uniref:Bcr/CflA subfamily drug resistance transporter n=1 Tax=Vibrio tubiashii ATCC 19109 TaxID=1051646 RepID=F9T7P1_9VIBR|nr:multidrug effflux MFS transporter [Vibrio tubiashii]AIW16858.1 major facilitator transporter [Vibrio tubiashii ATCC 19109]EGU53424.1 Bcr/CflA subfamily drug resistance transporter [Vibrio tubiashii ATCC 19109]EIF04603.1 Bcr/CflA subfamily drug resistance transporter [Vibrio tubiashii NCIMB 1337 = ATCC 19106]
MNKTPSVGVMLALMMFPQIVETIYSPALPHIALVFNVASNTAAQTLSIYFSAFALGVVFWGVAADYLGRRYSMLLGLVVYGVTAVGAMQCSQFETLLLMRALSAFGAAVGSVVTQTMLRDSYDGARLAKVFGLMGIGISLSPVIGLMFGGVLADTGGHKAVFLSLSIMAIALFLLCLVSLPETKPAMKGNIHIVPLAKQMLANRNIWIDGIMVACFNVLLFSYYLLGPFIFDAMGYTSKQFGYSGIILAVGTFAGSWLNKWLLARGYESKFLVQLSAWGAIFGAIMVWLFQDGVALLAPMLLVVASFGVGIPNILSRALIEYKSQTGSAGALFGLLYYLLISFGLSAVGFMQNLGAALFMSGLLLVIASLIRNN